MRACAWTGACAVAALLACAASRPTPVTGPSPPAALSAAPPRLVVAVVMDQLGSETLHTLEPLLDAGAFAHARAHGRVLDHVVYAYAATLTAPGHAAIYSGAPPAQSGVVANNVIDRTTGKRRAAIDDGTHAVLGVPDAFASPSVLRVDTVADALEAATGGRSKTVSLAIKDRSAVLPGGKRPDLVLFYEASVGFTTSSYYAPERPRWLEAFAQRAPIDPSAVRWEVADGTRLGMLLGPDDGPGEGNLHGLGTTFPYVLAGNARAAEAWPYVPHSSEHLLELAYEAAVQLELGLDDVPDLLMISVSGTDYAGHQFGPSSWEYADHLRRADRALLRLYERLAQRGSVAVIVTSDHGVAPLPERVRDRVPTAVRIDSRGLGMGVEAELDGKLGAGTWVAGYVEPYLYLSAEARARPDAAQVRAHAITWIARQPGIAGAFDAIAPDAGLNGQHARQVLASLDPERGGDVLVIPAFGAVPDFSSTPGTGTTHGSPWPYDTHVPVFMWGPGVTPGRNTEPLEQARVASTIAALLAIAPPAAATRPALPGAPAR